MNNEIKLSHKKQELYKRNAEIVKFYRRNPLIAGEDLLGIKLYDSQKYIIQSSWNAQWNCWTCSRNFGKSFLLAYYGMLKMLLYPNLKIYLISSVGSQAQETFLKLEDIAKQRIESISTLSDIFINEIEATSNSDGFVHDKSSFRVGVRNGSKLFTLNSVPNNIRGKRSRCNLYDESSFCSDEIISVTLPFLTQDVDAKVGVGDVGEDTTRRTDIPNQAIFASSAGSADSRHYKIYRDYALNMIAGDSNYFAADIPCDIPLKPMVDGVFRKPLLSQSQIDNEMKQNPDKAKREYYNKFIFEGGDEQPFKWAMVRRNETFQLPQFTNNGNDRFAIAFDPARRSDNSIITIMKIVHDERIGYYGEIVNCLNLLDIKKKKKTQMKSPEQAKILKQLILDYNGNAPDYEYIDFLAIDPGAGGGGITAYADHMLDDWTDDKGITHKGFIDKDDEDFKQEVNNYPNASDILHLVSPQKYKSEMGEQLKELMKLDVIKFPQEYNNNGFINVFVGKEKEGEINSVQLTTDQEMALINIDIMKTELTSIHELNGKFDLPKEKENIIHDDRFYTLLLLGHYLYKLRREDALSKGRNKAKPVDLSRLTQTFKKPSAYHY